MLSDVTSCKNRLHMTGCFLLFRPKFSASFFPSIYRESQMASCWTDKNFMAWNILPINNTPAAGSSPGCFEYGPPQKERIVQPTSSFWQTFFFSPRLSFRYLSLGRRHCSDDASQNWCRSRPLPPSPVNSSPVSTSAYFANSSVAILQWTRRPSRYQRTTGGAMGIS